MSLLQASPSMFILISRYITSRNNWRVRRWMVGTVCGQVL